MSRTVLIKTPENVELEYELAGIGTRFGAVFLDTLLQVVVFVVFWFAFVLFGLLCALSHVKWLLLIVGYIGAASLALMIGGGLLLWIGYFVWFETRWNGMTPGKKVMALRVINEQGYPVSPFAATLRNILRVIDFLPGGYAVGLVSIFVNGNYQRIGDMVGGTIVIKQRATDRIRSLDSLLRAARVTPEHLDKAALELIKRDAGILSPDEYLAVKHFTERRKSLEWDAQQISAMKLAVPLMERLGIVLPAEVTSVNYADFLEYLSVAYELNRRPT